MHKSTESKQMGWQNWHFTRTKFCRGILSNEFTLFRLQNASNLIPAWRWVLFFDCFCTIKKATVSLWWLFRYCHHRCNGLDCISIKRTITTLRRAITDNAKIRSSGSRRSATSTFAFSAIMGNGSDHLSISASLKHKVKFRQDRRYRTGSLHNFYWRLARLSRDVVQHWRISCHRCNREHSIKFQRKLVSSEIKTAKESEKMFTLWTLIEASMLCLNAVCILHEERFLAKGKCMHFWIKQTKRVQL